MGKSKYTKPELREKLKKRIMAGSKGGKPGQWSARKAQLLAQEYRKAGGGYRGGKGKAQRSLSKWTDEEWTTSDGKPAIRKGGTNRYLPKKAWDKLTPAERRATNRKKREASKKGRQFVSNTEKAKKAGRSARRGKSAEVSPLMGGDQRTKWDERVASRLAVMNIRADQISERVGIDVKAMPKLSRMKPSKLSPGARSALRSGVAILDELGFMRCPPGTANAMQFTDFRGSNCGVPGASAGKRRRFSTPEAITEFGEGIVQRRSSFIADRLRGQGMPIPGPDKRRKRLADSVRRLFGDSSKVDSDQANLSSIIADHADGFSWSLADGTVVTEGYAVARPGRGFRLRVDQMVDENGEPTEEAKTRLAQMVSMNAVDFTTTGVVEIDGKTVKAASTVLGGWKSDMAHDANGDLIIGDNGEAMKHSDAVDAGMESFEFFYFDLTDIFDEEIGDEVAYEIGKQRNQQSVAKLSAVNSENFETVDIEDIMEGNSGGFIDTEGTGGDILDVESFDTMSANAVSLLGPEGKFENVLRAIAGEDTLDIENFDDEQTTAMLRYLSQIQGFGWIDPDDPEHLYLALMQLSDNLMFLMDNASPEDRQKWSRWYDIANRFSGSLAEELDIPEQSMVAITAILSPQKDWNQNMAMAEHLARLMSDENFVVPEDVAKRAMAFAMAEHQTRMSAKKDGKGNYPTGSYMQKIASAEKKMAERREMVEKHRAKLEKKPNNEKIISDLRRAEEDVAMYEEQIADLRQLMVEDTPPELSDFVGKKMADFSDREAAYVVRAHGETYGGQYIGQDPLVLEPKDEKAGVYPTRLLVWDVEPDMEGEPGAYVATTGASKVAATSFPTYEAAIAAFRSDGDMDQIDLLLGSGSKVRSFFNNIGYPEDEQYRDVTVDTHAVAGLSLIPVGAKHEITKTAFGTVDSLGTGQSYPLYRAAMILAAERWREKTGESYLPREIQSITWEQIRSMVPAESKTEELISRMAQLHRLGNGPDADPRFSGENGRQIILEYMAISRIDSKTLNKQYGVSKGAEKLAYDEIAKKYGLPPLGPEDAVARAK